MSTAATLQINSDNSETSARIGQQLGSRLKGGEIIELVSDLGGGKTTLTKAIVEGAGSSDHVSSPTFTISNMYKTDKFKIYHFDFYRLQEAGLMEHELREAIEDPLAVVIIEWANTVKHILPSKRLTIDIKTTGETERHLKIHYSKALDYLVAGLVG